MSTKNEKGNRFTIRLDVETDRLLNAFAMHNKLQRSQAIREAIKQASSSTVNQKIADRLEAIEDRLSEQKTIARGIDTLSAQMADMTTINSTNTDRIVTVLKSLTERK